LSAGQARTYHAREFSSEKQNYWSRDQQGHSEWQGRLAQEWGLRGNVGPEEFARLSEGRHPESDAQLVKHQPAKTYDNRYGKQITSSEHRAGWDATFSAPKSVSLTALVGGDERVREAHRESVRVALHELERYTQARIEIGDISLELQPKLLRAVQEQEFERLGSANTISVSVRIIAATHRDLSAMISEEKFREDLFYRFNVFLKSHLFVNGARIFRCW